jgi:hypothetical protein
MAGYIFIPVPTPEMLEFAQDWDAGRLAKGKQPYTVLRNHFDSGPGKGLARGLGYGVLRNVTSGDKLYILAHGHSLGSTAIGVRRGAKKVIVLAKPSWTGGTMKQYGPDELAAVLEKEGLVKSFVDLRVFACGSANVPAAPGVTASFAQGLRDAMRALGYNSVRVTGYEGALRTSYAQQHDPDNFGKFTTSEHKGVEIGGEIFPASTRKIVFF